MKANSKHQNRLHPAGTNTQLPLRSFREFCYMEGAFKMREIFLTALFPLRTFLMEISKEALPSYQSQARFVLSNPGGPSHL
jgi:hypothetical protein